MSAVRDTSIHQAAEEEEELTMRCITLYQPWASLMAWSAKGQSVTLGWFCVRP